MTFTLMPVEISWDKEFQSQESLLSTSAPVVAEAPPQEQHHQQRPDAPVDDMARIAAQVIDSVKHEQNPKFQKSEFMNLMRQLRDGEVKVEDDKIVPKELSTGTADVKGKGRAVEMPLVPMMQDAAGPSHMDQSMLHSYQGSQELNEAYFHPARDPHEAYFHQENADFTEYWQSHYAAPLPTLQTRVKKVHGTKCNETGRRSKPRRPVFNRLPITSSKQTTRTL
jgi:peroxin-5